MPRPPKRHASVDSKANASAEDDGAEDLDLSGRSSTAPRARRGRGGRIAAAPLPTSGRASRSRSPAPVPAPGRRWGGRATAHSKDDDLEEVEVVPSPHPAVAVDVVATAKTREGASSPGGGGVDAKDPDAEGHEKEEEEEEEGGPEEEVEEEEKEDDDDDDDEDDRRTATTVRPLVLLGQKPRGVYECDYCGTDLTRVPRIRCAVCPDFDLCLECFATEDHEHMARYKREEEAQRRKDAARIAGLDPNEVAVATAGGGGAEATSSSSSSSAAGGKQKTGRGRGGKEGGGDYGGGGEDVRDDAIGSYVGGIWVPYFRHERDHGYIVADSARYVMFPSFRGVVESVASVAATAVADETNSENVKEEEEEEEEDNGREGVVSSSGDATNVDDTVQEGKGAAGEEINEDNDKEASVEVDSNANDAREAKTDDTEVHPSIIAEEMTDRRDADDAEFKVDEEMEDLARSNDEKAAVVDADVTTDVHNVDRARKSQPQRYRIVDDSKNAWTAEEDLRLLDGIIACGLGNWPDIAEHVNGSNGGEGGVGGSGGGEGANCGGKTDKQCMERYLDDFMGRYGNILPPYTLVPEPEEDGSGGDDNKEYDSMSAAPAAAPGPDGSDCDGAVRKRPRRSVSSCVLEDDESAPGFKRTKFRVVPTEELDECKNMWPHPYIPPNTGVRFGEQVARDLWYRSEQYFVRQTTGATSKVDAETIRREFIERRAQNLAGYEAKVLPPRLEDMKQLPGAELAGYMPRRGEFDIEWDNDAEKTIAEMEFSSDDAKADRELKLDVLRIFNTKLDEREKRKQFIIDHGLLNYRENQEKLWCMPPDERHLVQRMRLFARFHTREEHEAFVNKIIEAKRLRKEIAKLQMYRRMGITSLADAEKYEMDKVRRELHREAWIKKEEEKRKAAEEAVRAARENATMGLVPPPPPVPAPVSKLEGPVGSEANQSLLVWKQFKRSKKDGKSSGNLDNDPAKFIIKDKPGYELLSKKEVGLCKRLRLLPQNYLNVKRALISESLAQGIWNPMTSVQKQNSSIFKVDVTQRDNIIDFVLESGWIATRPSIIG